MGNVLAGAKTYTSSDYRKKPRFLEREKGRRDIDIPPPQVKIPDNILPDDNVKE